MRLGGNRGLIGSSVTPGAGRVGWCCRGESLRVCARKGRDRQESLSGSWWRGGLRGSLAAESEATIFNVASVEPYERAATSPSARLVPSIDPTRPIVALGVSWLRADLGVVVGIGRRACTLAASGGVRMHSRCHLGQLGCESSASAMVRVSAIVGPCSVCTWSLR